MPQIPRYPTRDFDDKRVSNYEMLLTLTRSPDMTPVMREYLVALLAEHRVMATALRAIAAHSGKTLISSNPDDMWQRGYSEGAHNGFNGCAAIAGAALANVEGKA